MNPLDLSVNQLKRAVAIKEQIEALNHELRSMLGGSAQSGSASKPAASAAGKKTTTATKPTQLSAKPAAKAKKSTVSAATRAKLSAKLKAFWAAKRAAKK